MFGIAFLITKPISKFLSEGRLFDMYLFDTFMDGYVFCLLIWPLFSLWYGFLDFNNRSFTSFFLQILILRGLSPSAAVVIQHLTQAGLFIFSPYIILR